MAELNSCRRCGGCVIIHHTQMNSAGEVVHQGNEWAQDPDLCGSCAEKLAEELDNLGQINFDEPKRQEEAMERFAVLGPYIVPALRQVRHETEADMEEIIRYLIHEVPHIFFDIREDFVLDVENGVHDRMTFTEFKKFCAAMGADVDEVLDRAEALKQQVA